jgi:hypothetical protein
VAPEWCFIRSRDIERLKNGFSNSNNSNNHNNKKINWLSQCLSGKLGSSYVSPKMQSEKMLIPDVDPLATTRWLPTRVTYVEKGSNPSSGEESHCLGK